MNPLTLDLRTVLLVRGLASGDSLAAPASDLTLASHGTEAHAVAEQRVFLAEHLARIAPEAVSRFALPDGVRIVEVEVLVHREGLTRRNQVRTPLAVPCVVIPAGADAWVVIVPLDHTFYVRADEKLDEAIASEVQRLAGALQLTPEQYLRLLPARSHALVPVEVTVERTERLPPGRAGSLRKALADRERTRHAAEVLASVAIPLHARLPRHAAPLVARDAERRSLAALLDGRDRLAVLLYGPALGGKSALVHRWLRERLARDPQVSVYATSGAQLIAGMSGLGQWEERVRRVMEAAATLDAVVYFDNLADLLTDAGDAGRGGVDLPGALKPWLEEGRVRVVAELRDDLMDAAERRHAGFFGCFSRVRVDALDARRTATALTEAIAYERRHEPHRVRLRPEAVPALVNLAERYLPYQAFPGKAFRLYDDLRTIHEKDRTAEGNPRELGTDNVHEVFSLQTGIPAFLLREDRALLLGDVVAKLRTRVVGQDAAVRRVAETVCVVKARLQPAGKPLANLLFVGPTGVGKTELARGLAALLFGTDERMTRFDMSEFTDAEAADRLIRGSDGAEGLLTRRVREQPFCVLLLDEIEKAHPAVFDLLLQVCGEGRLTDGRGRTAFFHNAIIILTSNLGAAFRRDAAGFSAAGEDSEAYYAREVNRTFRPEFVNRINRVVVFRPLTPEEVRLVAGMALARLRTRRGFLEHGTALTLTAGAMDALVAGGYSERYGARALRRHLEDHLVAPVARLLSRLGTATQPVAVHVGLPGEAVPTPAGSVAAGDAEADGLRVEVFRARSADAARDEHSLDAIARIRRRVDRCMELHRVVAVREQVEHLVAQLNYGNRDAGTDRRVAVEVAELQAEHHRLGAVWEDLEKARDEIHTLEEVGLMALFERQPAEGFRDEARGALVRFDRALTRALLAQERRRDAVTLLVTELDEHRAFDRWLAPLLAELPRRGWTAHLHVNAGERTATDNWPADRRWGPARTPDWMATALADPKREFRNVLVRCTGPWAGVLLALEAGLHRWTSVAGAGDDRVHLHVRLVGMAANVTDREWSGHPALVPDSGAVAAERTHLPPAREVVGNTVLVGNRTTEVIPRDGDYFAALEEFALAQLLPYERDDAPDRDELFAAPLTPPYLD